MRIVSELYYGTNKKPLNNAIFETSFIATYEYKMEVNSGRSIMQKDSSFDILQRAVTKFIMSFTMREITYFTWQKTFIYSTDI